MVVILNCSCHSVPSLRLWVFALILPARQRRDSRQNFAFQEFQARPAAGAHESDLVAEFGLVQCLYAIAAANDAFGIVLLRCLHDRASNGVSALGETLVLKQTHRTIPEDGFCLEDNLGVGLDR